MDSSGDHATASRAAFAVAGLSGALAVALSAWLAHAGSGLEATAHGRMETALRYQVWHSLLLAALAVAMARAPAPALRLAALACGAGLILFCGSLHLLALTELAFLAWLTPFGGLAFIAAWLALAWHGLAGHRRSEPAP